MKFMKVRRVILVDDEPVFRGHTLLELSSVREVKKYRTEGGKSYTRISYKGLDKKSDLCIEESPQDLSELYLKMKSEAKEKELLLSKQFDAIHVKPVEKTQIAEAPEPVRQHTEFQDHMFDTAFEELTEDV